MNEQNDPIVVPYVAFEGSQTRLERIIRRLVVALIMTIVLLFGSNALWLYAWMQYDYTTSDTQTQIDVDADSGNANYIGKDGIIVNGQSDSNEESEN